jgi:hypothetical protein
MERRALSTPLRLPALKSEYAGLDTITKRDLDIGYEDVFNGSCVLRSQPATIACIRMALTCRCCNYTILQLTDVLVRMYVLTFTRQWSSAWVSLFPSP